MELDSANALSVSFNLPAFSQGYILGDIVPLIFDGDFLQEDLQKLRTNTATAKDVDLLNAFMDEIAESQDVLWKLSKWKEDHWSPYLNCRAIDCFQNEGYNVYRIRPLKGRLNKYRILYAFNAIANEFHFLAVVVKLTAPLPVGANPGDFYNYEYNHSISIRIRNEYNNGGFPNTRR